MNNGTLKNRFGGPSTKVTKASDIQPAKELHFVIYAPAMPGKYIGRVYPLGEMK